MLAILDSLSLTMSQRIRRKNDFYLWSRLGKAKTEPEPGLLTFGMILNFNRSVRRLGPQHRKSQIGTPLRLLH
jgi:hypothetical protein